MKKGALTITLQVTVVVMLIVSTTAAVVGIRSINSANFEDYMSKVKQVADATLEYTMKNGTLPVTGETITPTGLDSELVTELKLNGDDSSKLFVIDMSKLDVSVSIGKGTTKNGDVFVVSDATQNIYYLKGREYKGIKYFGY